MKFVKLAGSPHWYEWDQEHMWLEDIHGNITHIDENKPEWINATIAEFENWHDVYKKTSYNPLMRDCSEKNAWLDPDGYFWVGSCHEIDAEAIYRLLYPMSLDSVNSESDYLIDHGWVKLSASLMFTVYCDSGMYFNITRDQFYAIRDWCEYHQLPLKMMIGSYDYD